MLFTLKEKEAALLKERKAKGEEMEEDEEDYEMLRIQECIGLVREWTPDKLPLPVWSRSTHRLYSPGFKAAVFQFLLCAKRLRLIKDMRNYIIQFLGESERKSHGWPNSWPPEIEQEYVEEEQPECILM